MKHDSNDFAEAFVTRVLDLCRKADCCKYTQKRRVRKDLTAECHDWIRRLSWAEWIFSKESRRLGFLVVHNKRLAANNKDWDITDEFSASSAEKMADNLCNLSRNYAQALAK